MIKNKLGIRKNLVFIISIFIIGIVLVLCIPIIFRALFQQTVLTMQKKDKWIYLLIIVLSFYLLPFLIIDTGIGMMILLIILPLICFSCSFLYGFKNKLQWIFPLLVSLLYIPSVFIFYNSSAMIYAVIYAVISLGGMCVGYYLSKK